MPLTQSFSRGFIFMTAFALFAGGTLAVQLTSGHSQELVSAKGSFRKGGPMAGLGFSSSKAHQGLTVNIEALDELTDNPNAKIRLHARVQLSHAVDKNSAISFNWNLPSSVEQLSGTASGMIPTLEVGEVWEQEILVVGLTAASDPQLLKLDVSAQVSGQRVASQGFFMTRPMQRDLRRAIFEPNKNREAVLRKTSSLETVEGEQNLPPKGIHF